MGFQAPTLQVGNHFCGARRPARESASPSYGRSVPVVPVEQVRLGLEPTKASVCPEYVWSVWVMQAGDTLATPLPAQGHPIIPRDFSQVLAHQGKVAHAFVFLKSSPPPLPSGH